MTLLEFQRKSFCHLRSKCRRYTVAKVFVNQVPFYEAWFAAEEPPRMLAAGLPNADEAMAHCELHVRQTSDTKVAA